MKVSVCCKSDVRSNGYIGGVDYGWTCNRCEKLCKIEDKITIKNGTM